MAKILYIFPHPDDESFGPGPAIAKQLEEGHEVHLLTLTKGGATKQRHKYDYSIDQMGEQRAKEMECVGEVLGLSSLTVWDWPDGELSQIDPIDLEEDIRQFVLKLQPDVLVTYAVHGNSGFPDHLVSHAVVKHVFCQMRRSGGFAPARMAFYTISDDFDDSDSAIKLKSSPWKDIDAIVYPEEHHAEAGRKALDCYVTYREVIEKTGIRDKVGGKVCYEFFDETCVPRAEVITEGL